MTTEHELPRRILVDSIVQSRYTDGIRPLNWDNRFAGIDTILTAEGEEVKLLSDGQQTPPPHGYTIMITKGDALNGFQWTLYGIK